MRRAHFDAMARRRVTRVLESRLASPGLEAVFYCSAMKRTRAQAWAKKSCLAARSQHTQTALRSRAGGNVFHN